MSVISGKVPTLHQDLRFENYLYIHIKFQVSISKHMHFRQKLNRYSSATF